MPSVVPGYAYDIFISYRQKDNRGDHWVTDFVNALKAELDATFKEDISIYFDENQYDGLLETHDVDESLRGKLKCLVFIPIISQTYCDPRSFAWKNEFLTFKKLASEDQFGLKIKLQNGNVASRILPVRIHELDEKDKTVVENEVGPLRAIDFIFKSAGVNRPLQSHEEHPNDNLQKTSYRDQINKIANVVKEFISTIQAPPTFKSTGDQHLLLPRRLSNQKAKFALASLIFFLLLVTGYIFFPRYFFSMEMEGRMGKSIAVLPFVDMSPEKNQEYLGDGIAEEIITALSKIHELKVIGRTSSFQFKGEKIDLREVGEKLDVSTVLEGSVMKSGNKIRVTAQLINVEDGSHLWSERYDRPMDDFFAVNDEISKMISDKMRIAILGSSLAKAPTNDIEAYNSFAQGRYFYESNFDTSGTTKAAHYFKEAIKLDSGFALPWTYLSMCYWRKTSGAGSPQFSSAKYAAKKALELNPSLSIAIVNMAEILDNEYNLIEAKEKIELALRFDPDDPYVLRNAGRFYTILGRQAESIEFCKRAVQKDPIQRAALIYMTLAYFFSGQYSEAATTQAKYAEVWPDKILDGIKFLTSLESNISQDSLRRLLMNRGEPERSSLDAGVPFDEALLAAVQFKLGNRLKAIFHCNRMAQSCSDQCAYNIARAYAYGEEKNEVLTWLERAYSNREKNLLYLRVEPAFKKYQNEPRFKMLISKIAFPN